MRIAGKQILKPDSNDYHAIYNYSENLNLNGDYEQIKQIIEKLNMSL